jgi:hypothetical protein
MEEKQVFCPKVLEFKVSLGLPMLFKNNNSVEQGIETHFTLTSLAGGAGSCLLLL